jgi:hypothetical protein
VKSMETAVAAMESMEMAMGALPRPDKVPEQRLLSPKIGLRWWRCYGTLSGKTPTDLGFSHRRLLIGGGAMSEVDQGPHTIWWRAPGGAPPYGVAGPWPPSGSPSDFVSRREKSEVRDSFRPILRKFPV